MQFTFSTVKDALTGAPAHQEQLAQGKRGISDTEGQNRALREDIDKTIMIPAKTLMTSYVTARVEYYNTNENQEQDLGDSLVYSDEDAGVQNLYVYRCAVTHPPTWLNDTIVGNSYGDKDAGKSEVDTYQNSDGSSPGALIPIDANKFGSITNWKIEKFQLYSQILSGNPSDGVPMDNGVPVPEGNSHYLKWRPTPGSSLPKGLFVSNIETYSNVTNSKITQAGLSFTTDQLTLTAEGWDFGMDWLHATPSPQKTTSPYHNVYSSHGVFFKEDQANRQREMYNKMEGWYNKQNSFTDQYT